MGVTDYVFVLAPAAAALISAIVGFFVARWLYADLASARVAVLQSEIMRLRRRLGEYADRRSLSDRQAQKMRRDIKQTIASAKQADSKAPKRPALTRYDRSYGSPPNSAETPSL
ncbi:MAG: hypothetical protein NW215_07825 [Hyphomicrobiales bacterium]|nr:hypothetical protein [Hyphomicrobiales bacterium]